jgi:bifunctional UDP-N-acetylglucosamine pyrophosphorylase/glucosamine-1-phosphate N-acetyltransferase
VLGALGLAFYTDVLFLDSFAHMLKCMIGNTEIVVLAAGLGTRMKSQLPKVLHRVCGQPMLALLLEQLDEVLDPNSSRFNVVVGHGRENVTEVVRGLQESGRITAPVVFTVQEQQLGTGHAVKLALEQTRKDSVSQVAVFNGDLPLFTSTAFMDFFTAHKKNKSSASLASTVLANGGQYGRILRKAKNFAGVVEYKDASASQRLIREINGGVYFFERSLLQKALAKMGTKNAAKEFYLPDVFQMAAKERKKIYAHLVEDSTLLAGVNNMKELAEAQAALYWRKAESLMAEGVFLHEPRHTYIGPEVRVGKGCSIGAFTAIHGDSVLADRVTIGAHCDLRDVSIGEGTLVRNSTVAEKAILGKNCAVGPMAHFRPGTKLQDDVRVGNFVEVKASEIGAHTNAAHLSYIGDASIGSNVNLGCGFVTCNYDGLVRDGKRKHRTVIGDNVFVGSDSQVVAPIEIASGTYIASGSTVVDSVEENDSLVIARSRQVTKPGYAKKYRK